MTETEAVSCYSVSRSRYAPVHMERFDCPTVGCVSKILFGIDRVTHQYCCAGTQIELALKVMRKMVS